MAYVTLTHALSTDLVNEVTHFNNNWDAVDTGLKNLISTYSTFPVNPDPGLEYIDPTVGAGYIWVWNGTAWKRRTDSASNEEIWNTWQTITLTAPIIARPGFTPKIRNSNLGNVQMVGGVQNGTTPDPWPTTGYVTINSGQFGTGFLPEMSELQQLGGSIPTSGFQINHSRLTSSGGFLKIDLVKQRGTSGGGDFIMLDQIRYKAV